MPKAQRHETPGVASLAVTLSSDWLSRTEPHELAGFWFDVAASRAARPDSVRLHLVEAVGAPSRQP